jgi:hypothetical protein
VINKNGGNMKNTLGDYKYKQLFEIYENMILSEDTRGEYWITDSGDVIYADGDIGDMNHETIIIDQLTGTFLNIFDIDEGKPNPVRFYYEQIGQNDLEAILRGLGEAYPDIDEENPEDVLFNIEVMATGEYYTDVPLSVLDEKDLLAIHRYA